MRTSFKFLADNARQLAIAAAAAGSLLMAGGAWADTGVNQASDQASHQASDQASVQPQVRADIIYVYAFGASPDQVKLDNGMAQKLETMAAGGSAASEQSRTALEAREQVSDEIVRQLQSQGLHAVRADGPPPADSNVLIVEGNFQKIDEGKRRRRLLIGLGAGKSEVTASVRILYKPANGSPVPLQSFSADANSGHMPGVAETAGAGAAAGHLATAGAAGTGLHGVSEVKRDSISADATRLGDSIAKKVAAAISANGWMPATQVD
jgi:outer membrane murein-binding lipoprotein Lpp